MPVRLRAQPPAEFVREHLTRGPDWVGHVFQAYKAHLRVAGVRHVPGRLSFSRLFWLLTLVGAIQLHHEEPIDASTEKVAPGKLPRATAWDNLPPPGTSVRGLNHPSPRRYYEIVNPGLLAWTRPEQEYRRLRGLKVVEVEAKPSVPKAKPEAKVLPLKETLKQVRKEKRRRRRLQQEVTPAPPAEEKGAPLALAPPAPAPQPVVEELLPDVVGDAHSKLSKMKTHNSAIAEKALDELETKHGLDVDDARDKLQEFRDTTREDFQDTEEYQKARDEAWGEFLDAVKAIEGPEPPEVAEVPAPPAEVVAPPQRKGKPPAPTKPKAPRVSVPDLTVGLKRRANEFLPVIQLLMKYTDARIAMMPQAEKARLLGNITTLEEKMGEHYTEVVNALTRAERAEQRARGTTAELERQAERKELAELDETLTRTEEFFQNVREALGRNDAAGWRNALRSLSGCCRWPVEAGKKEG